MMPLMAMESAKQCQMFSIQLKSNAYYHFIDVSFEERQLWFKMLAERFSLHICFDFVFPQNVNVYLATVSRFIHMKWKRLRLANFNVTNNHNNNINNNNRIEETLWGIASCQQQQHQHYENSKFELKMLNYAQISLSIVIRLYF